MRSPQSWTSWFSPVAMLSSRFCRTVKTHCSPQEIGAAWFEQRSAGECKEEHACGDEPQRHGSKPDQTISGQRRNCSQGNRYLSERDADGKSPVMLDELIGFL